MGRGAYDVSGGLKDIPVGQKKEKKAEDLGIEHTDKVIEIEMTQAEIAEVRKTKRKLPEDFKKFERVYGGVKKVKESGGEKADKVGGSAEKK